MTWAEFRLRSFGFWEDIKEKRILAREKAYQTFTLPWRVFGKRCPYSKERFWPIESKSPRKDLLSPDQIGLAKKLHEQYLKEKNGKS